MTPNHRICRRPCRGSASIDQAKPDCRHDESIHRSDPISVIAEECPPALGWRVSSPDHLLGHAGLSDIDAILRSSPWIRGTPHSGLEMPISRIRLRISGGTVGRPPPRRDFHLQYDLDPARCHFMTVSAFTIARPFRTVGPIYTPRQRSNGPRYRRSASSANSVAVR